MFCFSREWAEWPSVSHKLCRVGKAAAHALPGQTGVAWPSAIPSRRLPFLETLSQEYRWNGLLRERRKFWEQRDQDRSFASKLPHLFSSFRATTPKTWEFLPDLTKHTYEVPVCCEFSHVGLSHLSHLFHLHCSCPISGPHPLQPNSYGPNCAASSPVHPSNPTPSHQFPLISPESKSHHTSPCFRACHGSPLLTA